MVPWFCAQLAWGKTRSRRTLVREYQLRIYRIKHAAMAEWVDRWSKEVVPARHQFGFEILGGWTNVAGDEFLWLVAAGDTERSFAECEAAYQASRAEVRAARGGEELDPTEYLAGLPEVRMLMPVYLPHDPGE
jgi:hypothetical protein